WAILLRQKQKKLIMLPSETMIWQPEFTDKTLSRKPGAVHHIAFSVSLVIAASCKWIIILVLSYVLYDKCSMLANPGIIVRFCTSCCTACDVGQDVTLHVTIAPGTSVSALLNIV
ncbi:hypothetical protein NX020_26165, partial [Escherichia coli]|nr:hypothetical protein [Escherichia coli]